MKKEEEENKEEEEENKQEEQEKETRNDPSMILKDWICPWVIVCFVVE